MLLMPLPKILFFGGKGGVGKTTLATATALGFADRGERVLLLSTDPAHSIGDLLEIDLDDQVRQVASNFFVRELDPEHARVAYIARVKENIRRFAQPEFLQEAERQVELAGQHPGVTESALFEALCQQLDAIDQWDRIVVDTAPTGHTLHLLNLPESMQAWTSALLAKQSARRHSAPEAADRWQKARDLLAQRQALFTRTRQRMQDAALTGFILVMNDDRLSVREAIRARESLMKAGVHLPAVAVNKTHPEWRKTESAAQAAFQNYQLVAVPSMTPPPQGLAGMRELVEQLRSAPVFRPN